MKRFILILTAAAMALSLCGCAVTDWVDARLAAIFPTDLTAATEETAAEKPNLINTGIYDFDTFNPLVTQSQSVREAMQLVYEPLYRLDENMRPVPVLAADYARSADGRTITLNLKQNVKWHDGAAMTMEDVAYTFKVILANQTSYTNNLRHVADYTMTGDYSMTITLKNSVPSFVSMLTFPIVRYQTDMNVNGSYTPVGTGPFCCGSKTRVDEIHFSAFDSYHGGRAAIDEMTLHIASSREKYMTMLEASEIDFSSSNIVDLTEYMPKGSLSLYDFAENTMVYLGFNMASPLFFGAQTRAGIAELIDKARIVNSVIFSRGTAANIPINPASYLYYGEGSGFEADELAANDYLGNDGWGPDTDGVFVRNLNGTAQKLSFNILVNADSAEQVKVGQEIAAQLNRFGVIAKTEELPFNDYSNRIAAKNYDAFLGEQAIDANMELTPLTDANGNYFSYNNPELATINAQMGMTNDEEELKSLFRQYADTVLADMPFAVIYYKKGSLISSANVKSGISPSYVWLYGDCGLWRVKE